jgi:hypothetical protein
MSTTSNSVPKEVEHARQLIVAEHAYRRPRHLRPKVLTLKFFL